MLPAPCFLLRPPPTLLPACRRSSARLSTSGPSWLQPSTPRMTHFWSRCTPMARRWSDWMGRPGATGPRSWPPRCAGPWAHARTGWACHAETERACVCSRFFRARPTRRAAPSVLAYQDQTRNTLTSCAWLVGNMLAFTSSKGRVQINQDTEVKVGRASRVAPHLPGPPYAHTHKRCLLLCCPFAPVLVAPHYLDITFTFFHATRHCRRC